MNRVLANCCFAAAMLTLPSLANAQVLYDQTNLPDQFNTPMSIAFMAGGTSTTLDFQGYTPPGHVDLYQILLTSTGGMTNLLGTTFNYTPAACGPAAAQAPGTTGTNNLSFTGLCEGSYDSFTQTVATSIGASYTLSYVLTIDGGPPNGLRIFASDAVSGVPEPATWAMMLLGFGAMGLTMRLKLRARRMAQTIS